MAVNLNRIAAVCGDHRERNGKAGRHCLTPNDRLSGGRVQPGAVNVEHVSSQPKGAKSLYVWQGMWEILDRDLLMYDILRFAAERMRR